MNNYGWQRALDIQMDTLRWCNSDRGRLYNAGFFESHFETALGKNFAYNALSKDAQDMARHVCISLARGDTVYVTSDMLHLMMQAAHDLPEDVVLDTHTLLSPYGFCLFEEPLLGEDKGGNTVTVHAISWEQAPIRGTPEVEPIEAVIIYFWTDPYDYTDTYNVEFVDIMNETNTPVPSLAIQHFYPIRVGDGAPEPVDNPGSRIVTETIKLFFAMNMLAQQKIGTPIKLNPDRATRKRYHRMFGKDAPERLITLITLRRKRVQKDDEEPQKVEWSRRWVVRGFWRRQWYPSAKRHDWKYIHEYIKGPEDKPLVIIERRVFNFRR